MEEKKYKIILPVLILLIASVVIFINVRSGGTQPEPDTNEKQITSLHNVSGDIFSSELMQDLKRRNFIIPDKIISNSLKISSNGEVKWKALRDYPSGCDDNQAIQKIGDKLTCININTENSSINWLNLENYPNSCSAGQAIQAIGRTLTCVDVGGEISAWTDGGDTVYLNSSGDNLAIGGTSSTSPFYFDNDSDRLQVESFRSGSTTNNLSISSSGILTLSGSATVFDDLLVPVTSTTKGGTKDPSFSVFKTNGSGSQGVFTYWFDSDSEEELYFTAQLPHSYKEGSNIYPHVHWVVKANGSDGQKVSWGLECNWANRGDIFGSTNILYANTSSPNETLVADKQYLTPFSSISGTGKTVSSMLTCRVFRNATGAGSSTDNYAADAGLLEIDFHYEKDKLGSDEEF